MSEKKLPKPKTDYLINTFVYTGISVAFLNATFVIFTQSGNNMITLFSALICIWMLNKSIDEYKTMKLNYPDKNDGEKKCNDGKSDAVDDSKIIKKEGDIIFYWV